MPVDRSLDVGVEETTIARNLTEETAISLEMGRVYRLHQLYRRE